jgi:hypothetical protein
MIKLTNINGDITDVITGVVINHVDCMDDVNPMVHGKWDISASTPVSGEGMCGLAHMINVTNSLYVANCYFTQNDTLFNRDRLNHCVESAVSFADYCEYDVHILSETWFRVGYVFLPLNRKYNVTINIYDIEKEI